MYTIHPQTNNSEEIWTVENINNCFTFDALLFHFINFYDFMPSGIHEILCYSTQCGTVISRIKIEAKQIFIQIYAENLIENYILKKPIRRNNKK